MEIEDVIKCSHCGEDSILYIFDGGRKEIRFYPNPYLDEIKIKHPNIKLRRLPNKESPDKYDVLMYCPVCGKLAGKYIGVPLDWSCLDTPTALIRTPIKDLKPWIVKPEDIDRLVEKYKGRGSDQKNGD